MSRQYGFLQDSNLTRRSLLKIGGLSLIAAVCPNPIVPTRSAQAAVRQLSPDEALRSLLDGNQRFVAQSPQHPHQSVDRLKALAQVQNPIATILSCADSRVPAELLFDVGLGDIFNVRVAGNVVNPEVIGSLEYAVALLNTPLLIVLGHERCGAVTAAVKHQAVPGSIGAFVRDIEPAIERVHLGENVPIEDVIDDVVIANVQYQMGLLLKQSSLIADRRSQGLLDVVGVRYDLDSGTVRIV